MPVYVIKLPEIYFCQYGFSSEKGGKANFSPAEISVLTEKFEENMDILQSKFTNSITNAKKKQDLGRNLGGGKRRRCDSKINVGSTRQVEKPPESRKKRIQFL